MLTAHCIVCTRKVSIADIIDRKCPACRLFQEPKKEVVIGYTFAGDNVTVTIDGVKMEGVLRLDHNTMMRLMLTIFPNATLGEDKFGGYVINTNIVQVKA